MTFEKNKRERKFRAKERETQERKNYELNWHGTKKKYI